METQREISGINSSTDAHQSLRNSATNELSDRTEPERQTQQDERLSQNSKLLYNRKVSVKTHRSHQSEGFSLNVEFVYH